MGGFGSGEKLNKKTTVEECLKLNVGRFVKQGSLKPQTFSVGDLTWTNSSDERILLVRYWLENTLQKTVLHLTSRVDRHGREDSIWEDIVFTSTKPNLGGERWWFICPLIDKASPVHAASESSIGHLALSTLAAEHSSNRRDAERIFHVARFELLQGDPYGLSVNAPQDLG